MKKGLLLLIILGLSGCSFIYEYDSRSAKVEWKDSQLSMKIAGIVNKAPYLGHARVNTVSYEGKVLLVGQAKTEELKSKLVGQVKQLNGVKHIYDQIRIKSPLPISSVSNDTWLTTKVKSALIGSKKLRNVNIKVMTEDREVFLLGYVTKEQGAEATKIVRNLGGVKQVVQGFEYVGAR